MSKNDNNQNGAVSLFVVVFATLLIVIITVGFAALMIRDQQQATANDLSQSALDSAQAGVEDGKRAIVRMQACSDQTSLECIALNEKIAPLTSTCTSAISGLKGTEANTAGEIKVQTNTADSQFDQAYTCVKVMMDTPDYLGILAQDGSKLIPLKGVGTFKKVMIEWTNEDNLGREDIDVTTILPELDAVWPPNRPAIMRAQFIGFESAAINLDAFNNSGNSNTLFFYPNSGNAAGNNSLFASDTRIKNGLDSLNIPTKCYPISGGTLYSCTMTVELPYEIGPTMGAFLNLTALYKKANFRVTLFNSAGDRVDFNSVQPEIDSTGRANDLFRRVKSRIEMINVNFPYPQAAVDITGSFCKDFWVTNNASDYDTTKSPKCEP